eukprot:6213038-Pleurochrysis_carterae.AAC.1
MHRATRAVLYVPEELHAQSCTYQKSYTSSLVRTGRATRAVLYVPEELHEQSCTYQKSYTSSL